MRGKTARVAAAPELAVVIASLNEAASLPVLLADLQAQIGVRLELIVADGGSSDGSPELAKSLGAKVVVSARGRGLQLNAGAAAASAPWLLFLHADSRIPAPEQLRAALEAMAAAGDGLVAGHWPLRFLREQSGHDYFYLYLEGKTASNRPGSINGDQGLLLRREHFCDLGGFDATLPFFEDQRIAARIHQHGRFVLLPGQLLTSARRFEQEGHGPRYALMALIVGMEAAGLKDLMAALPAIYREQSTTQQLALAPFLRAIDAHLSALPKVRQGEVWQQVGKLLLANTWQIPHALDCLQANAAPRWLGRYSQHLEPRLQTAWAQQIARHIGEQVMTLCFRAARWLA